ncbi:hypothetical protein I317_07252 [Kwoniella heveanensis CBS 569]|nr:hypothetical protein I317_07252 [Kwoniella heveanensis CBS 569]
MTSPATEEGHTITTDTDTVDRASSGDIAFTRPRPSPTSTATEEVEAPDSLKSLPRTGRTAVDTAAPTTATATTTVTRPEIVSLSAPAYSSPRKRFQPRVDDAEDGTMQAISSIDFAPPFPQTGVKSGKRGINPDAGTEYDLRARSASAFGSTAPGDDASAAEDVACTARDTPTATSRRVRFSALDPSDNASSVPEDEITGI